MGVFEGEPSGLGEFLSPFSLGKVEPFGLGVFLGSSSSGIGDFVEFLSTS